MLVKLTRLRFQLIWANNSAIDPVSQSKADSSFPFKQVNLKEEKKAPKSDVKSTINGVDFAAKITNKVNQSVKEERVHKTDVLKTDKKMDKHTEIKAEKKNINPKVSKTSETNKEYVTDDQFFDDFFADDDD